MVRTYFFALFALAFCEGMCAQQPQSQHQVQPRDIKSGRAQNHHERSLTRKHAKHISPQNLELQRKDEAPSRHRRNQVADAFNNKRQLVNKGADPGSNNLQADGAAVVNPAAQAAAGNGDFFEDQGFVAGQTQQFGDFFDNAQTTQAAKKERRQVLDDAGNLAAGNGDFFEDDGFQAANTAVFGDFFQGGQPTQAANKERRQVLNGAGKLAAGNGDFFEDDGFRAGNTDVFGDFFQGSQPTPTGQAAKKMRRQVLNGAGNLAAGNGDFFEDEGFQAANTEVFGDFFQDNAAAATPALANQASLSGAKDQAVRRDLVGDIINEALGNNDQQQQQQENNGGGFVGLGQNINGGFFGDAAQGQQVATGVLNPFGQQDGVIQGQTGAFGDFFTAGTGSGQTANTNNANTQSAQSTAAAETQTAETSAIAVSTTMARSTAASSASAAAQNTAVSSAADEGQTSVQSVVQASSAAAAESTAASQDAASEAASAAVSSESAVEAATSEAASAADSAASAGDNNTSLGIGGAFISTGKTEANAAEEATAAGAGAAEPSSASSSSNGDLTNVQAAAEAADTSAYQLPGRQLTVLPIGLGVFGGVSAIALIVVGVVTYERKKYRKQYRDRKAAEAGGRPMQEAKV